MRFGFKRKGKVKTVVERTTVSKQELKSDLASRIENYERKVPIHGERVSILTRTIKEMREGGRKERSIELPSLHGKCLSTTHKGSIALFKGLLTMEQSARQVDLKNLENSIKEFKKLE